MKSHLLAKRQICLDLNRYSNVVNSSAIKYSVQAKAIMLCDEPFTTDNGLLTPTHKMKRHQLRQKFKNDIQEMYKHLPQNMTQFLHETWHFLLFTYACHFVKMMVHYFIMKYGYLARSVWQNHVVTVIDYCGLFRKLPSNYKFKTRDFQKLRQFQCDVSYSMTEHFLVIIISLVRYRYQ